MNIEMATSEPPFGVRTRSENDLSDLDEVEPGVYRTRHEMDSDGLTTTISTALAAISNVPVTEYIQDFSDYADPDALNRLFRSVPSDPSARESGFTVLYIREFQVTIRGDGEITIENRSEREA